VVVVVVVCGEGKRLAAHIFLVAYDRVGCLCGWECVVFMCLPSAIYMNKTTNYNLDVSISYSI